MTRALLVALLVALAAPAVAQTPEPAGRADAVRAFYATRDGRPLWTAGPGQLSPQGGALLAALARLNEDGLDPEAYRAGADEYDLTRAFLDACEHLQRGRVDPEAVHRDWRAERRPFQPEAALALAARAGPDAALRAARPLHAGYVRLRRALADVRALEGHPWPPLPDRRVLRLGDEGDDVAALRERLTALGLIPAPRLAALGAITARTPTERRFDTAVDAAVRAVQARSGLAVDGVVGSDTRDALDRTPFERARQIRLNLERWRWLPADLGDRHVLVNAGGQTVALVEGGRAVWEARAIVGTARTPTPGLTSVITHAVLSPYWDIPASITQAEILPRVARDPGYLARHHMERLPGGRLRQRPGPDNPLGPVKFIFDNPFGVRLHGTSAPALFERPTRLFSHGCIRAERPLDLVDRLLSDWNAGQIAAAVAAGRERRVALDRPVPIHVVYWTAWVAPDGALHLRPDAYGRDRLLETSLDRVTP